jgi:hypothetical protein
MSASNPTWTNDIQKMFTPTDIDHMNNQDPPIDLSSYDVVRGLAGQILAQVSPPDSTKPASPSNAPNMPPQNTPDTPWWTQEMINTFTTWMNNGCPQ